MEMACKVFFGFFIVVVGCFAVGFIAAWWEQRERDKNKRR
ncbi:hypothetical protein ES708_11594 [subsurface metagenome]